MYKKYVDSIHPYEPGKPIDEVQKQYRIKKVIKLASNENPLGVSRKAIDAIKKNAGLVNVYPDGGIQELKKAIAKYHKVKPAQIIVGNGSNEIIEFLIRGFVREGDCVVSSDISFLVYPLVTQVAGAEYVSVPMKNFKYDLMALSRKIDKSTKVVFIANPNNPTGTYVNGENLKNFLEDIPKSVVVCVDEAYFDFVTAKDYPNTLKLIDKYNLIVLRTFSKSYGLAGLRLGFGVANERLISYLHKIRQPFNVNHLAQVAGIAALTDKTFLKQTQKVVVDGRNYLEKQFKAMGLFYIESEANFVLVCVKTSSKKLFQALLKKGVIIRDMAAYGMNEWVRVSVGTMAENRIFIKELKSLLGK